MRAQGRSHNLMLIGKNKGKMGKKALCLIFAFLLSINSFAAVVSDNDGAAFITKAEFDSLKNNFQSQIDQYNTSIDSKIDGAIASYLAGIQIAKQEELKSLINSLGLGFVSSDKIDFPVTGKGSYRRYFINLGICKCQWSVAATLCQLQYVTGAINVPQWKTINDTSQGIFYLGETTDSGNYKVQQWIKSEPYASVLGIVTGGSQTITGTTFSIPSKTFTNGDTNSFMCSSDTWSPTVGSTQNVNVAKAFGVKDAYTTPKLDLVTGAQLNTDNEYFVKSLEINKPSSSDYTDVSVDACGYEIQAAGISWTVLTNTNTKLRVYNHQSTTMKKTNIVQDKITGLLNQDIFYYNGCPIFTVNQKDGKVKLKLKFTNSGSKQTVFKIQDSKFDNTAISETGAITDVTNYKLSDTVKVNAGTELTLEFEVKKDTTYWIKARPLYTPSGTITDLTYPTYITTTGILFTEEQ